MYIDTHVHLRTCFPVPAFLEAARRNANAAGGSDATSVLLFADAEEDLGFSGLMQTLEGSAEGLGFTWHIAECAGDGEVLSIVVRFASGETLVCVAGRQLHSSERIELLALATTARIADGLPLNDLIQQIRKVGGVPVLPWGVGKWFGRRGRCVKACLQERTDGALFLGDTAHRRQLVEPMLFRQAEKLGVEILPGSDPLPFPEEVTRPGSFGIMLDTQLQLDRPARHIRDILLSSAVSEPYGERVPLASFMRMQSIMQMRKRGLV